MIILKVKRPNGQIEEVETKFAGMNDILFSKIKEATAKAGKGEVISWSLPVLTAQQKKDIEINDLKALAMTYINTDNAMYLKTMAKAEAMSECK